MKRAKYLLLFFMALIVLTGCSSNGEKSSSKSGKNGDELVCTMNIQGMQTDMSYTWKDGKINTVKAVVSIDLSKMGIDDSMLDMVASQMQSGYIESVKQAYGIPANQEGYEINAGVNKDKKTIEVSVYANIDEIDPALLDDAKLFNKEDLDKSYDDIKKQLEKSGATCN